MNDVKDRYARSDFEKLLYALLPSGDNLSLTTVKKCTVSGNDLVQQINTLKENVKSHIPDEFWTDTSKLDKTTQKGAAIEFDLYLTFDDETSMNFGALFGAAGTRFARYLTREPTSKRSTAVEFKKKA